MDVIGIGLGCLIGFAVIRVIIWSTAARCPKCQSRLHGGAVRCSQCREDFASPIPHPLTPLVLGFQFLVISLLPFVAGAIASVVLNARWAYTVAIIGYLAIGVVWWLGSTRKSAPEKTEVPPPDSPPEKWPQDDWTRSVYHSQGKPPAFPTTTQAKPRDKKTTK